MLGVRGVCAPVCVRAHTGERTLPLCPSRHLTRTKPLSPDWRPKSSSHPGFRLLSTTAPTENGLRNLPSKKGGKKKERKKILARSPKSLPSCPSHSPIWILLGKLAPTTAPRKPVQKKAKMYGIFLFTLAKKKPWSNHRFGLPSPPFDSS